MIKGAQKASFVKKQHNFPRKLPWTSHRFPEWVRYPSHPNDRSGTDSKGQPNALMPGACMLERGTGGRRCTGCFIFVGYFFTKEPYN